MQRQLIDQIVRWNRKNKRLDTPDGFTYPYRNSLDRGRQTAQLNGLLRRNK